MAPQGMRNVLMRGEIGNPCETNEIPVKERTLLSLKKGEAQLEGAGQAFLRR
jgi:hypothetical protein